MSIDLTFSDFISEINLIKNNDLDWIPLLYSNKSSDGSMDDYIMSAMFSNTENAEEILNFFDWGFSPDSFGHSTFWTGLEEDKITFTPGNTVLDHHTNIQFEYLIANRYFESTDFSTIVDINPLLIWYGNLYPSEKGFIDPKTKDLKIKVIDKNYYILCDYLRDFLAAYQKKCIICFDNRRFSKETIQVNSLNQKESLFAYQVCGFDGRFSDYTSGSSILGKVIIESYTEPRHEDYLYFKPETKQFETFIIGIDKKSGQSISHSCNEDSLSNFFGKNPGEPHFLTPVYFSRDVLTRYTSNPVDYEICDDHISYLNDWSLPYTSSDNGKIVVWLGDLGRIPYNEQSYWKVHNIVPHGKMDKKFIQRQLLTQWTDSIGDEKTLFSLIATINDITNKLFNKPLFLELSDGDSQLKSAFMIPSNNSFTQLQIFINQLNKLTVERINTKLIETIVSKDKLVNEDGKSFGARIKLNVLLTEIRFPHADQLNTTLKLIYDSRCKLADHVASLPQYNKAWNRNPDEKIDCISDAKYLIQTLNANLRLLIEFLGDYQHD